MLPVEVLESTTISDAAKVLYAALSSFAEDGTGSAWPKVASLAKRIAKTDRTTRRLLVELEDAGWITRAFDEKGWRTYTLRTSGKVLRLARDDAPLSEVSPPPLSDLTAPPLSEVTASIRPPLDQTTLEKKQGSLFVAIDAHAAACARGDYDGFSPPDIHKSEAIAAMLETTRAASWGERPRSLSSQDFRKAWRQIVLVEKRKPSEIMRAIRGIRADGERWPERKNHNGWSYIARRFDDWLKLAAGAEAIGAEPKRADYETNEDYEEAFLAWSRKRRAAKGAR